MHVTGDIDPVRDIEIVTTELVLADLETIKKRLEKIARDIKRADKHALQEAHLLEQIQAHLNTGKPANTLALPLAPYEKLIVRGFFQDILDRIELEPVREALGAALEARIPQA